MSCIISSTTSDILEPYLGEYSHLVEWGLPIKVSYMSAIIRLSSFYTTMLAAHDIYKCCVCTLVYMDASRQTSCHRNQSGSLERPPPHCLSSSREIGTSKETPIFKTYGRARVAEMWITVGPFWCQKNWLRYISISIERATPSPPSPHVTPL